MITTSKREDLKGIIVGEKQGFANEISFIVDKLKAVHNILGEKTDDTTKMVETVTKWCLLDLEHDSEINHTHCENAGLRAEMWFDVDGFINIEYHYRLA